MLWRGGGIGAASATVRRVKLVTSAPASTLIWSDDFEVDNTASYFEYESNGGNFRRVEGAGFNGSWGMVCSYQSGVDENGNLKLGIGRMPSGGGLSSAASDTLDFRELYVWMRIKCDADYLVNGTQKMLRMMVIHDNLWSEACAAHIWTDGSAADDGLLLLDPASGTDAAGAMVASGYNDVADFRWLGTTPTSTNIFIGAERGEWHTIEVRMKLNTAGQSDGILSIWIDDVLEANLTDLNWVGAYSDYGINAIFFENYVNNTAPAAQDIVIDEIKVSTVRVGTTALSAGSATVTPGDTLVTLAATPANGGDEPYSYQWYRSTSTGFTPGAGNIMSGFTSLTGTDTGRTNGTTYYYKLVVTDESGASATYAERSATPAVAGGDPDAWFEEDFSAYTSVTQMISSNPNGWIDTFNVGNQQYMQILNEGVPEIGTGKCLRYNFPAGFNANEEIRLILEMPDALSELWLELWVRCSNSFTTAGPQSGNDDYKWVFLHTLPDESGRIEMRMTQEIEIGEAGGLGYPTGWLGVPTNIDCVSELDSPGNGHIWDGKWYRYRYHVDLSYTDGKLRFWMKPTGQSETRYANHTGITNWRAAQKVYTGMDNIYLGANMNTGCSRAMQLDWGRVRVYNVDPGWV